MSIAHDTHHAAILDRFRLTSTDGRQPNLLLPSARFTLFALTAIMAGAALAFIT